MPCRRLPPIFTLALLAAASAAAQDAQDTTIVVTGTRTGEGAAASTSVVSADDVARLQPPTLRDALDGLAGVRAVSTGGAGGGSFVSIRGAEPNFTMVLLDGVRLSDTTNSKGGAFDFALIDPALVERIEVDRGAASAVHGSDALSGVIAIHLREPEPGATHGSARIEGSTGGELGGSGTLSHGWQTGGLLLGLGAYDSGTLDPGSDLRRRQGLARLSRSLGGLEAILLATYAHDRHSIFPEDSGGPELAVNRERETGSGELWATALTLRAADTARLRPHLSLSYAAQTSDVDTPAIAPGVLDAVPAMTAHNRLDRFEGIANLTLDLPTATATLGAAYLDETGRSDGSIDFGFPVPASFSLDRRTASGFAEGTLRPAEGLTLNGALRFDAVASGPEEWTGKLGIAYRIAPGGPALFARLTRGFKLPSFYALANPLVGNPDLAPERSRNIEAGIDWPFAPDGHVRLAWFDNRFTDLVDFDAATFKLVNRSRVDARGIEAEGSLRPIPTLSLTGALTWLDLDSPVPLRGRPRWQGRLGATWQATDKLELGAALRFNGRYNDSSVPTGFVVTPGHAEFDASLRYALSHRLRLDLALRNLGDARTWQAVGYPVTGRTLRATLAARF